ncbi:hypothetical protein HCJ66_15615 [Listeria sp. FSL L7-1582]|uniref:GH25 family lysozyme n=1 Tax=Listeria portnoyi TaxID=2713504 RepID=UPI00164D79B6|nr:GH25 family lysozyme [Listeria portnoyi]MBC6310964.1 hypothetical protein [Listeria portnoyi]
MAKIIDVSHHQTPAQFDWPKLAKEVDGIIIRVQFGTNVIDREYKNFIAKAKQYKIPFGLYAFGMFVSVADAKIEAQNFLKRGDSEAKFWALDVEKETIAACGTKNLAAASQAFIDVLKAAGKKTGFYYEHQYVGKYKLETVKADFLWIPRYGSNNGAKQTNYAPAVACDLWQYTSVGLAGSNHPVDLSDLRGSKKIDYFFGSNKKTVFAKHDLYLLPRGDWNAKSTKTIHEGYAAILNYDVMDNGFVQVEFQGKTYFYSGAIEPYWYTKNPNKRYEAVKNVLTRADPRWGGKASFRMKKGEEINVVAVVAGWLKCSKSGKIGYLPNDGKHLKKK